MPTIRLSTQINAPIERVFDLARDLDAHMQSTARTKERAVAGRTSGLIELGETVTWQATHFGIRQHLTVEITQMEPPHLFEDVMTKGAFKSMRHLHRFSQSETGATIMQDELHFHAPLGILGRLAEYLFLTKYMRAFLLERNRVLKQLSENL